MPTATNGLYAAGVAAVFFVFLAGVAYVVFRMLKKTVTMAFRMALVAAILVIAVVGSISLWYFSSDTGVQKPRPTNRRR